jgi:hypothetical protein
MDDFDPSYLIGLADLPVDIPRHSQRSERIDYHLLNDGSDEEGLLEDRIFKKPRLTAILHDTEPITPDDSASQLTQNRTPPSESPGERALSLDGLSEISQFSKQSLNALSRTQNASLWAQFDVTPLPGKLWWPKRGKRDPLEDRDIHCKRCSWKTTDSARATSTTNMKNHLGKHGLLQCNNDYDPAEASKKMRQQSVATLFKRNTESETAKLLEQNLIHWTVTDDMAFTVIESPAFRKIFEDLPGISLPFSSRKTLSRRIDAEFHCYRAQLIEELDQTCKTIALSLDVWTSKNSKAILGVIGHWLTADFQYQERVLEFAEIEGPHSGQNMAELLQQTLAELQIEHKVLTITADNAANNETLMSELYLNLTEIFSSADASKQSTANLRFQGVDSYIRCLAHVLNLIVSDILSALKAGDHKTATAACDLMQDNKDIGPHSALARLRIMALWIARTPQRKQQWKFLCQSNKLKDKFIEYDVDTRWNSTHRMLRDALAAKQQIRKWINHQTYLPPFTADDWVRLQQIETVLSKFEEFTLTVSKRQPQISLAIPIYYELQDMLHDAIAMEGEFSGFDPDIASAVLAGMDKYKKYYDFMDAQDAYYVALVLDPRFKALLLEKELGETTALGILSTIKESLHDQYPLSTEPSPGSTAGPTATRQSIDARVLQKLQPEKRQLSDIDRYFKDGILTIHESVTKDKDWLFSWWRLHRDEFPRMAAAARDFLAIPAAEVAVERLFSRGRDLLGLRRHSLSGETMRRLVLLRDIYKTVDEGNF